MVVDLSDSKYEKDILILERLSREITARQSILAFMIDNGMHKNENFKEYYNELLNYQSTYDYAKNKFYKEVLTKFEEGKTYTSWSLDFENREVIFYE